MPVSRSARWKAICDPSRSFLPSVGEGDDASVERGQGMTEEGSCPRASEEFVLGPGEQRLRRFKKFRAARCLPTCMAALVHRTLQAQQRDPGEMQLVGLVRTAGRDRQFACGKEATLRIARTDRVTDQTIIGPVAMACTSLSDTRAAIA